MASDAAQSDLWPLGFELPCSVGLFEKPSWFNNISSLGAAEALSCLTPVAPSDDLQRNCCYLPQIRTSWTVVCHASLLVTLKFVLFLWDWQVAWGMFVLEPSGFSGKRVNKWNAFLHASQSWMNWLHAQIYIYIFLWLFVCFLFVFTEPVTIL